MTDSEIIKFIEHAINSAKGEDGFKEIYWEKLEYILNLINRQKAENERLKMDLAKCSIRLDNLYKTADEIKSEAIKEFAEKMKNCFAISGDYLDIINIIDNLVKEMTE